MSNAETEPSTTNITEKEDASIFIRTLDAYDIVGVQNRLWPEHIIASFINLLVS
jgi:hypothetical protein